MADKEEEKIDKKIFKIYNKLKLEINKYESFKPSDLVRVVVMGMKMFEKIGGMRGNDKKERLISLIKLLIKEYGEDNFDDYDTHLIYYMIDDLHTIGFLNSKCIIM